MSAKDSNIIFVGKKPLVSYALAVVTTFTKGASEVTLKARGKLISRAVDVAEVVRNKFMPTSKVKDVKINSEEFKTEDGKQMRVSTIEIILSK